MSEPAREFPSRTVIKMVDEIMGTREGDSEDLAYEMGTPFFCPACSTWQPMDHSCSVEKLEVMSPSSYRRGNQVVLRETDDDDRNIVYISLNVTTNGPRGFVFKGKLITVGVSGDLIAEEQREDSDDGPPPLVETDDDNSDAF